MVQDDSCSLSAEQLEAAGIVVIWCSMPWPLSVGSLSSLPFTLIKTILQLLTRKNGGHGQSQRRKGDIKNKPKLSRNKAFHSVNCDEHALKHTSCPHDSTRPSQTRASDLAELPCRERWGKSARRAELDSKTLEQDYMSLRWLNHRHRSLSSTNHKTSKLLSVSLGVGHQTRTVVKNLPALQENNVMQQVISALSASTSRLDPWVIVAEALSVGERASTNLGNLWTVWSSLCKNFLVLCRLCWDLHPEADTR